MNSKILKQFMYIFLLIASMSFASASNMTIDELIESYDYNYYDGSINVTSFNDYMIDANSNGINDTLIINLTTDTVNSSMYYLIVMLYGNSDSILNYTNKTVNSSDKNAKIIFDTKLLNSNQYNYSVEIRRQDYSLAYMKYKSQTNTYSNYKKGNTINSISDQNINNNSIRITTNINVTTNETSNVTFYLSYNNQSISSTKQITLTTPIQNITIDFDNETIKSTHYSGAYKVESVKLGDKIISTNYTTSLYNYEDFTKTTYIKNITSEAIDNNSNNLFDLIKFNFTINTKSDNDYIIEAALYDSSDNYIATLSKNVALSTGTNIVSIDVDGKDIYSTYHVGEFKLSYSIISIENSTIDIIFNPHTTGNYYYNEFEKPPLPDLVVDITLIDNSTANITVTNIGEIPAFNTLLDIFDDTNLSIIEPIPYINISESKSLIINLSTDYEVLTAIVDFNNFVDEKNESNNIAQYLNEVISLKIDDINILYSENTLEIFEFIIINDGNKPITDIQWTFSTGDGEIIYSDTNISSISPQETARVFIKYNYSNTGTYIAYANATGITASASKSDIINVGNLMIDSLDKLTDGKNTLYEFIINNHGENDITDINWSFDTGETTINSTYMFNLTTEENIFVFVTHNYTNAGNYNATANVKNYDTTDSKTINVNIFPATISGYTILSLVNSEAISEFEIINGWNTSLSNASWKYESGENNVTSNNFNLSLNENIFVFIYHNYTASGNYSTAAKAKYGTFEDSKELTLEVG